MKTIRHGHQYQLASFEGSTPQTIQFIEKTVEGTVHDGTTNEEVLAVLIDRLNYLQAKMPCRENALVITKLEEALLWLNHRTNQRKARGVDGSQTP